MGNRFDACNNVYHDVSLFNCWDKHKDEKQERTTRRSLFSCRSVTKPYSSTSSKGSGKHKSITPNLQLAQSEVKIKIT